ncbi:mannonate dehydratase [Aestuariibius sp. HNIBRBA575]|uniref:mannonate dehydratase n=1 Tax=Aestuariibius sp. HNIBRBA575 TaxID=3233343 RepID=UPI0034A266D0
MLETWRWFGPNDPITLAQVKQTGARGVVTALHDKQAGEIWPLCDIVALRDQIAEAGLRWDVCESIWMPDDIKLHGAQAHKHLSVWKDSLANLGRAGVKTVCYNFMPVLDWTRTDLAYSIPGTGKALRFDCIDFALYDVFVLARPNAADDYSDDVLSQAQFRHSALSPAQIDQLERNIIAGLPGGAAGFSRSTIASRIAQFDDLTNADMRANFAGFLAEIVPVAAEFDIKLAIHPDDPPFSLFGLPRIVSTADDLQYILDCVDHPSNGLTFCTGSLGARADNDLIAMAQHFGDRIHFAHLRNVQIEPDGSFHEAQHLAGSTDMIAILQTLRQLRDDLPMRPDHGHLLDYETANAPAPGYSYLGRLKGLSELRGAIATLQKNEI